MPRRRVLSDPRRDAAGRSGATRRAAAPVVVASVVAVLLVGCTGSPTSTGAETPSSASGGTGSAAGDQPSASSTDAPTPAAPLALVPDGSARDNLPLFTSVVAAVWSGGDPVAGRSYIDALVAAGFDKAAMQVTQDVTTIGNPAEAIQFAVRWGNECLTGQVGPTTPDPVTAVLPGLPSGGCLLGETRAIDW